MEKEESSYRTKTDASCTADGTCSRSESESPALFDESSQCSSEVGSSCSARSDESGADAGDCRFNDFVTPPSRVPFTKKTDTKLQDFDFHKASLHSSSEASSSSAPASDAPSDSDDYSSGTATPDFPLPSLEVSPGLSPQSSPRLRKRRTFRPLSLEVGEDTAEAAGTSSGDDGEASFATQRDPTINGAAGSEGFYKSNEKEHLPEWCPQKYGKDDPLALEKEILDYVAYIDELVKDTEHSNRAVIESITAVAAQYLPGASIRPFGSYATGLCIPSSDIDLVCSVPDENIQRPFRILSRALHGETWVDKIKSIETASFPVIKLIASIHKDSIPVDISFDCSPPTPIHRVPTDSFFRSRHRGIQAADRVCKLLHTTPKLRPLVIVLKQFLFERDLNKPYNGGLGSFCLLVMVKAFLNKYDNGGNVLDLGGALTSFLRFYGIEFNYATTGISLRHDGTHFNIGDPGYYKYMGAALTIEDPFDPMNNIGASSFNMAIVKQAFAKAFQELTCDSMAP